MDEDERVREWAERVLRLIGRLRARGVDEQELLDLEIGLARVLTGGAP